MLGPAKGCQNMPDGKANVVNARVYAQLRRVYGEREERKSNVVLVIINMMVVTMV